MDVIFDIDGTLADLTHRRHFIQTKPKNWKAFQAGIPFDGYHHDIFDLLMGHHWRGDRIVLASGRNNVDRYATETWLRSYPNRGNMVMIFPLYMRKDGDYRSDDIVKEEILADIRADGFNPTLAYDDRDRVVAMWRRNGIRCLQVAPGSF